LADISLFLLPVGAGVEQMLHPNEVSATPEVVISDSQEETENFADKLSLSQTLPSLDEGKAQEDSSESQLSKVAEGPCGSSLTHKTENIRSDATPCPSDLQETVIPSSQHTEVSEILSQSQPTIPDEDCYKTLLLMKEAKTKFLLNVDEINKLTPVEKGKRKYYSENVLYEAALKKFGSESEFQKALKGVEDAKVH
jgi:hypothetical protein